MEEEKQIHLFYTLCHIIRDLLFHFLSRSNKERDLQFYFLHCLNKEFGNEWKIFSSIYLSQTFISCFKHAHSDIKFENTPAEANPKKKRKKKTSGWHKCSNGLDHPYVGPTVEFHACRLRGTHDSTPLSPLHVFSSPKSKRAPSSLSPSKKKQQQKKRAKSITLRYKRH